MAGRPPFPIGSHGKISTRRFGSGYQARCRFRDADGQTRPVSAVGKTSGAAERNLRAALLQRPATATNDVTGDTRLAVVAELSLATIRDAVASGERSPSTIDTYSRALRVHVLPALGALKLREVTTSRVDRFLTTVRDNAGPGIAKTCRTVLSGVLNYAQRHDAISHNPTRGTTPLSGKPRRQPRALTRDERSRWLTQLNGDATAVYKDLPDLVSFMLGTGTRIGESLAVAWPQVDLDAATVEIAYTLIRVTGHGLVRKTTKTAAGTRVLPLPPSIVDMLRARRARARDLIRGLVRAVGEKGTEASTSANTPEQAPTEPSFAVSAFFALPPDTPVFPDSRGGWRDPANTRRDIRNARGSAEFSWLTSHALRKTAATMLDEAGFSARDIANHLGHARPSITQDSYMGRGVTDRRAAAVLDTAPEGRSHKVTGA